MRLANPWPMQYQRTCRDVFLRLNYSRLSQTLNDAPVALQGFKGIGDPQYDFAHAALIVCARARRQAQLLPIRTHHKGDTHV